MVAMATTFRNEGTRRARPERSSSACASLKATPAPHRNLQGYPQPGWFGLSTASARGTASAYALSPLLRHQVVIGDDQVHARALGGFGGGKGADAGVHADDQP